MISEIAAHLASSAEADLLENLLPYWVKTAPDPDGDGFVGQVGPGEVVDPEAPRGALLTSRILWTFSAAHLRWPEMGYLEMADRAHADLVGRFWDEAHGGLYWSIAADGLPLNSDKNIYGQAFGIFALTEYYQATGHQEAQERAIEIYRLMDLNARDRTHGGFLELFATDWSRKPANTAVVMGVGQGAKSQNTHLHVMEAFTNLLKTWPDAGLLEAQQEVVDLMLNKVLDKEEWHLHLFFDDAWGVVSTGVSYGHDIEAAWLMQQAAEQLGDGVMIEIARKAAVEIARATLAEGLDADGALFYAGEPDGPTNRIKAWWPQAEGVVGFLNAWQVSGDDRFLEAANRIWTFIEETMIDRENGGWFHSISPDGRVLPMEKIGLWTCPYHNARAAMEMIDRLGGHRRPDHPPRGE